jgi:Predicted GTPase
VTLRKPKGKIVIDRARQGNTGIRIVLMGKLVNTTEDEIRRYLESFGIKNALVKIFGEVTLDDVEREVFQTTIYKPSVTVTLEEFSDPDTIVVKWKDLEKLEESIFRALDVIRVYTKEPDLSHPVNP